MTGRGRPEVKAAERTKGETVHFYKEQREKLAVLMDESGQNKSWVIRYLVDTVEPEKVPKKAK